MLFQNNTKIFQRPKKWISLFLIVIVFHLAGCAIAQSGKEYEHGLSVSNKGDTKIYDVVIKYGAVIRTECPRGCPARSGGGVWNQSMPIPETMQVSWRTEDGSLNNVNVAVKSRVKDSNRLRTIYLEFKDNILIVKQGLRGLEEYFLYP